MIRRAVLAAALLCMPSAARAQLAAFETVNLRLVYIDPTESFELTNAVQAWDMMKEPVYDAPETLDDGSRYQVFHIQAVFSHAFPLHAYPFDQQDFVIELEDSEYQTSDVVYVDDVPNTNFHPGIEIPGWETGRLTEIADGVQRSAFPEAYQRWEGMATALAAAQISDQPDRITCVPD